jgi:hypothetical protein
VAGTGHQVSGSQLVILDAGVLTAPPSTSDTSGPGSSGHVLRRAEDPGSRPT